MPLLRCSNEISINSDKADPFLLPGNLQRHVHFATKKPLTKRSQKNKQLCFKSKCFSVLRLNIEAIQPLQILEWFHQKNLLCWDAVLRRNVRPMCLLKGVVLYYPVTNCSSCLVGAMAPLLWKTWKADYDFLALRKARKGSAVCWVHPQCPAQCQLPTDGLTGPWNSHTIEERLPSFTLRKLTPKQVK